MPKEEKKHKNKDDGSLFKSRKIRIKVIGVGGGGAAIVSEVAHNLKNAQFLVADSDSKTFKKVRRIVKTFPFGEKLTNGMGTGGDVDLAQRAILEEKERLVKVFKDQDIIILLGCLGGGVASGAGPVFAEVAKNQKCISVGIFTLPFAFEGEKKMKTAKRAVSKLQENLSGIIVVPNERIFQLTDKKMSLKKSLSTLNNIFAVFLQDLMSVILKPSIINIDFSDLKTILRDRGHPLFFSRVIAQGPNRAEQVVKNIFQNSLFENPPQNIKRILYNIAGGKDLRIKEVEMISSAIANANSRAKIIFGLSELPKAKGKISLTLLAVSEGERKLKEKEQLKQVQLAALVRKSLKGKKEKAKEKRQNGSQKIRITWGLKKNQGEGSDLAMKKEKIRRSALEIQQQEEEEQKREWASEPEWEIPAFLRKKME